MRGEVFGYPDNIKRHRFSSDKEPIFPKDSAVENARKEEATRKWLPGDARKRMTGGASLMLRWKKNAGKLGWLPRSTRLSVYWRKLGRRMRRWLRRRWWKRLRRRTMT
jgi:hypothetical protein